MTITNKYGEKFGIKSSGNEFRVFLCDSVISGEHSVCVPKEKLITELKKFLSGLTNKEKSSTLQKQVR